MSLDQLIALTPLIAIAAVAVIVMLVVAVRRNYRLTVYLTLAGFLACLALLPIAAELTPTQITPLIIMDKYAVLFIGLVYASGLFVTLLCADYFERLEEEREELYILLLTASMGAAVLVASDHFASFFLGLETLSVSLFAMIAYPLAARRTLEAGIKYLILSGVSSAFLLFGMALIYADTGALSFAELGAKIQDADTAVVVSGIVMIVAALGFKLSLVPFHMWTPDVYQGAPAPVTAFVATVSKGAVFAVLLRYFASAGGYQYAALTTVLAVIAVASILAGNLLALLQNNVKRILAYSSIAHMGYVLVAFIAGARLGPAFAVESVGFYLLAYMITTLGAFGVVAVLSTPTREAENIADFQGLFWTRPVLGAVFTAMLLSLAGIPLTVGFIGKFYIFTAGVDAAHWALLGTIVIGSGIGLYYYLRIAVALFKAPSADVAIPTLGTPMGSLTLVALAVLSLWFGIFPNGFMELLAYLSTSVR